MANLWFQRESEVWPDLSFSTEQMKGEILFDIILLWDFKHEIRFAVFHILLSMQNVLLIIQPVCVIHAFYAPANSKG